MSSSSHFFNKTDFEQYLCKQTKYLLGQEHHIVSPQMRALPTGRISHVF